jgi:hypothetical protein
MNKTLSHMLGEEFRLRLPENRVFRRVFGPKEIREIQGFINFIIMNS